jgi:3',5'-cyclic-AMP phosphodiesterase
MIVFAQVSDTHLDGGERRAGRLSAVMEYLNAQRLDAIVVTGDIADHGLPTEYEQARAIFGSSRTRCSPARATTTSGPRSAR